MTIILGEVISTTTVRKLYDRMDDFIGIRIVNANGLMVNQFDRPISGSNKFTITFYGALCADRHKNWGSDFAMR